MIENNKRGLSHVYFLLLESSLATEGQRKHMPSSFFPPKRWGLWVNQYVECFISKARGLHVQRFLVTLLAMANTNELLDMVIDAHGGIEKWQSISEITARIRTGGILFKSKFVSSALSRIEISVATDRPLARITPFPSSGYKGIFDLDSVYIESDAGERIHERSGARTRFKSFRHNIWWDYLDALYFVGYASFNYLCTPFVFLLPGIEVNEIEPWTESEEVWRRLAVIFPKDMPTHCREQVFYFDSKGFLRRLDYTAEVVATWAKAAHYCWEYRDFSGLAVPTKRKVFPRKSDNKAWPYPVMVSIDIQDLIIA